METIATFHIANEESNYGEVIGAVLRNGYPFGTPRTQGGVPSSITEAKNPDDFRKAVAEFFLGLSAKQDLLTRQDMVDMKPDEGIEYALDELNAQYTYTLIEGRVVVVGLWKIPILVSPTK